MMSRQNDFKTIFFAFPSDHYYEKSLNHRFYMYYIFILLMILCAKCNIRFRAQKDLGLLGSDVVGNYQHVELPR